MSIIIPGPASEDLAWRVAGETGLPCSSLDMKRFFDGEASACVGEPVAAKHVVIIQSTGPPQHENLLHLLFLADSLREAGASGVVAVVPYLAFARQDKQFRPGEAISAQTVARLLFKSGIRILCTVNCHNPEVFRRSGLIVFDLSALPLLAAEAERLGFGGAFSLSLGKRGEAMAAEGREALGGGGDSLETVRDATDGSVKVLEKELPVAGRNVVIFDDIVSSGSTMEQAVAFVRRQGAYRILVACVHPLLDRRVEARLREVGANEIIGTDSVPTHIHTVSIVPLIAGHHLYYPEARLYPEGCL